MSGPRKARLSGAAPRFYIHHSAPLLLLITEQARPSQARQ